MPFQPLNPFSRKCPHCNFERCPEQKNVKEGRNKYVIYRCSMCHKWDIERWADRPRPKIWDGKSFLDEDLNAFDDPRDKEDYEN